MLSLKSSQIIMLIVLFCSIFRDSSLYRSAGGFQQRGKCNPTSCVKPTMMPIYHDNSAVLRHRTLFQASALFDDHPKDFIGPPIKAMLFIDGTWLYYNMIQDRDCAGPITKKYGVNWLMKYFIDWKKLPCLISENLNRQLSSQSSVKRMVEIVRTSVFTSMRPDTIVGCPREAMIDGFYEANFDVHKYLTKYMTEKCVDIALASEMLYLTTVPDAYDIGIIITGDKDFIPALEKVRLRAKRVAICSVRYNCNKDLANAESRIRDFDMIWLDDFVNSLIVPRTETGTTDAENKLVDVILNCIKDNGGHMFSRSIGRVLHDAPLGNGLNALAALKGSYQSLRLFLERFPDIFCLEMFEGVHEFSVTLKEPKDEAVRKEEGEGNGDEDDTDISETDEAYLLGKATVPEVETEEEAPIMSIEEVNSVLFKLIVEVLQLNPGPYPSRELGRKLKESPIDNSHKDASNALELLKLKHKSLYAFIAARNEYFDLTFTKGAKEFFVTLKSDVQHTSSDDGDGDDDDANSIISTSSIQRRSSSSSSSDGNQPYSIEELQQMTVKALRDLLKEAGQSYSGTKAVLIERSLRLQTASHQR